MNRLILYIILMLSAPGFMAQDAGFNQVYPSIPGGHLINDVLTTDDGYYVLGTTQTDEKYAQLVKLAPDGSEAWTKRFSIDGMRTEASRGPALCKTFDDGLAFCGALFEPGVTSWSYILRLDSNADSLWRWKQEGFGFYSHSATFAMIQTSDSGFAAVGAAYDSIKFADLLIVKLDQNGNLEWWQTYGDNWSQIGYSIVEGDDGYYIGADHLDPTGWDHDAWVVKVDKQGNLLWEDYLLDDPHPGKTATLILTDSHLYAGTGIWKETLGSNFHLMKGYLGKYDHDGQSLWKKEYGSVYRSSGFEELKLDRNGNLLAVGESSFDTLSGAVGRVMRISQDGDSLWQTKYDAEYIPNLDGISRAWCMDTTLDGGFITAGLFIGQDTLLNKSYQKLWVVKFDSNGCFDTTLACGYNDPIKDTTDTSTVDGIAHRNHERGSLKVFPNPAGDVITIVGRGLKLHQSYTLHIYSTTGLEHSSAPLIGLASSQDVSGLTPGMYIAMLRSNEHVVAVRKFIKQ